MKPNMPGSEATDSIPAGSGQQESSVLSLFKMTKGCVMLKAKRHVSLLQHLYGFVVETLYHFVL